MSVSKRVKTKVLMIFMCLCFDHQARLHHGSVELSHLSGEHLGLPHRRSLCLLRLGNVLHRPWTHHCLHGDPLLLLPGWESVSSSPDKHTQSSQSFLLGWVRKIARSLSHENMAIHMFPLTLDSNASLYSVNLLFKGSQTELTLASLARLGFTESFPSLLQINRADWHQQLIGSADFHLQVTVVTTRVETMGIQP